MLKGNCWMVKHDRHSVSLCMYFTYIGIPNYCRPCAQYIASVLQEPVRHCTTGIKTHKSIQIMLISSHEIEHSFLYNAQCPSYQNPQRRYDAVRLRNEERPSVFFGTLPVFRTSRSLSSLTLLTILKITHLSATHLF